MSCLPTAGRRGTFLDVEPRLANDILAKVVLVSMDKAQCIRPVAVIVHEVACVHAVELHVMMSTCNNNVFRWLLWVPLPC